MSNPKSFHELPKGSNVAQKCDEPNGRDKQQGVKRPLSTPQSPLKIEQQRRSETLGTNVSNDNLMFSSINDSLFLSTALDYLNNYFRQINHPQKLLVLQTTIQIVVDHHLQSEAALHHSIRAQSL